MAKANWELVYLYHSLVPKQTAGFRTERQNRVGRGVQRVSEVGSVLLPPFPQKQIDRHTTHRLGLERHLRGS